MLVLKLYIQPLAYNFLTEEKKNPTYFIFPKEQHEISNLLLEHIKY